MNLSLQTEKKLEDAKKDLETFVSELSFPEADINASVLLWKRDVQQFAIGMMMFYTITFFKETGDVSAGLNRGEFR